MDTTTTGTIFELDRSTAPTASREVFAGLSVESRFLRFHTGMPALPARMWRHLDAVDGITHVALGARIETRWVGIVRLIRTAPGEAELALAVVDRWQRRGVGRALITAAREHAEALGYRRLHAEVLAENTRALSLLDGAFEVHRNASTSAVVSLELA